MMHETLLHICSVVSMFHISYLLMVICSLPGQMLTVIVRLLSWSAVILSTSLSTAVFFIQFLHWFYSDDQRASVITSLPNPGPPPV